MKKHAKKSLLLPILALVSVVAIAACCYLAQTFNAFAVFEPELESTIVDNGTTPAPDAEESEDPEIEAALEAEPNPSPEPIYRDITARIHLSTNGIFGGKYEDSWGSELKDFTAWTGELWVTYHNVLGITDYAQTSPDGTTYAVLIGNGAGAGPTTIGPIYAIRIPSQYYQLNGVSVNYNWMENMADITINVTPVYYICFVGNGGTFAPSGGSVQWIAQGEYNNLNTPTDIVSREGKAFAGWYTDPFWGERVSRGSLTPGWGEVLFLYAHWVDNNEEVNLHFETADYGQWFSYVLTEDGDTIDEGTTFSYSLRSHYSSADNTEDIRPLAGSGFFYGNYSMNSITKERQFTIVWSKDSYTYNLVISGTSNQRIETLYANGGEVPCDYAMPFVMPTFFDFSLYNNFVIGTSLKVPGYMAVASDDGSMFKCEISYVKEWAFQPDSTKLFATDYLPIFVGANEYVSYTYNRDSAWPFVPHPFGAEADSEYVEPSGVAFKIIVSDYNGNETTYTFFDNIFTLFDWYGINNHILSVDVDGEAVPQSSYIYHIPNGYHSVTLNMTDKDFDTTVTYKANGGKFADDSDTVTLDAVYGEALPLAETPKAAGMDFDGWYTEPVGGFKVDPAHYLWMPWDRWNGVTLYAHWVEAPVPPVPPEPVPPEPVPPVPGPTPDNPGGAQTGDSMPLAPIAAIAIVAALGCGLAIRKEYF